MYVHFKLYFQRVDFVDEMFRRQNDWIDLLETAWKSLTVSIFAKIYGQKYPENFETFC